MFRIFDSKFLPEFRIFAQVRYLYAIRFNCWSFEHFHSPASILYIYYIITNYIILTTLLTIMTIVLHNYDEENNFDPVFRHIRWGGLQKPVPSVQGALCHVFSTLYDFDIKTRKTFFFLFVFFFTGMHVSHDSHDVTGILNLGFGMGRLVHVSLIRYNRLIESIAFRK